MAENRQGRLDYLENLSNYKTPEGAPDVQGWTVVDTNHNTIGKVAHLLGDTDQHELRYLDVKLDKNAIDNSQEAYAPNYGPRDRENKDANILLPVGMAHVDQESKRVVADRLNQNLFSKLPRHSGSKGMGIKPEDEDHLRSLYDEEGGVQLTGERKFNNKKEISDEIASPAGPKEAEGADKSSMATSAQDFYNHQSFDLDRFYGRK